MRPASVAKSVNPIANVFVFVRVYYSRQKSCGGGVGGECQFLKESRWVCFAKMIQDWPNEPSKHTLKIKFKA